MRMSKKNRIKSVGLALLMIITSMGTQFMLGPIVAHAAVKEIAIPIYVNFYKATGKLDSDGIDPELVQAYENSGNLYAKYNLDEQGNYVIESSSISVGTYENNKLGNFDFSITMPSEEYAPAIEGYKFRGWGIDTSSSSSPRATSYYLGNYSTTEPSRFRPIASNTTITYDLQKIYNQGYPYDATFVFSRLSTDAALQEYSINIVPVYAKLESVEVQFSGSELNEPFSRVVYQDDPNTLPGTVVLPRVEDVIEAVDPNKEYYWVIKNNILNDDLDWRSAIYNESAEEQIGAEIVFHPGASVMITTVSSEYADEPYFPYNFRLESIDKSEKYLYCLLDENKNGIFDQTEKEVQGTLTSVTYSNEDKYNKGAFGTYQFSINIEDELESTTFSKFNGWKYEEQIYEKGASVSVSVKGEDMEDGAYQIKLTPDFEDITYDIELEAKSDTVDYDGEEHSVSGFKQTEFVFDEKTYSVSGVEAKAIGTEVGSYTSVITGTAIVKDIEEQDVTEHFNVTTKAGTLKINSVQGDAYSITHEDAIFENKGDAEESVAYPGSQIILSPVTQKEGYSWALFTKSGEVLTYDVDNNLEMEIDGAKVSFIMPEADVVAKYLPVLSITDMENGVNSLILSSRTQMLLEGGSFGSSVTFQEMSSEFTTAVEANAGRYMLLTVPGDSKAWYENAFQNDADSQVKATFYARDAILTVTDATSGGKTLTEVNTYLGEKFALTAGAGEQGAELVSWMELDVEYPVSEMTSTSSPFSMEDGVVYYTVSGVATEITVKPVYKTKYAVTVDGEELGKYVPGATVTLEPVSTEYKVFKDWKVTSGEVTITNNQFTMPSSDVEVTGDYDIYASSFAVGSALRLAKGVPYKFGSGKYKVNGDATTYMGDMTFYVSSEGEYTFTEE